MTLPKLEKIGLLPPLFNEGYRRYLPSAYDSSLTMYEQITTAIEQINRMGLAVNEIILQWDKISEWLLKEGLEEAVIKQLTKWKDDGTLSKIISETYGELCINVSDFKKEDCETDDTGCIQRAIDYAYSKLGEFDKKIAVNLGNREWTISAREADGTSIIVHRGVTIIGESTLHVKGVNTRAFNFLNSVHCAMYGNKILLEDEGQIGIYIDTKPGGTSTQLNNFTNVWIEGDFKKNTKALYIGYAWVNNFFGCKFFRCADGIEFAHFDSNSNSFFGCEIRSSSTDSNSKLAILHRDGKNNVFIGGAIENYNSAIDIREGDLKLIGVYTEAFNVGRPFVVKGGIISFDNCMIKGLFNITGGKMVRVTNCDFTKGGFVTNRTNPLIGFYEDVDTEIYFSGNVVPKSGFVVSRYGEYYKDATWKLRSPRNRNERYEDNPSKVLVQLDGVRESVSGDDTEFVIDWGEGKLMFDSANEFDGNTGVFTPKTGGIFEVSVILRVEKITDQKSLRLFLHVSDPIQAQYYSISQINAENMKEVLPGSTSGSTIIQSTATVFIGDNRNMRVRFKGSGGAKDLNLNGGTGGNIWSSLSIKRVA